MNGFNEKVIIITGASSGIGAALARSLAGEGAKLILAARNESKLNDIARDCRIYNTPVVVVPTDVSQEADCDFLVQAAIAHFGKIDILINNAGISHKCRFDAIKDSRLIDQILDVNLKGSLYCTRFALPYLKKSRGLIVAVSSLSGLVGLPTRSLYAASKHAMMGFFDSLRLELRGSGVDVTMICPGFVATPLTLGDRCDDKAARTMMPVETCCQEILRAMRKRKRQHVMTLKGRLGQWLKLIFPKVVDQLTLNAVKNGP